MPCSRKQRLQGLVQDCLFLKKLPGEIRNEIYKLVLVSPTPIDLCPVKYAYKIEGWKKNQELQKRYLAFQNSDSAKVVHRHNRPTKVAFRLQSGLLRVRKHLAVALLATCRQIFYEAASYFWGDNVWRFSGDRHWEVLRRFLLSLGPTAKPRIRKLSVVAPTWQTKEALPTDARWHIKNHPKLHMAKLYHSNHKRSLRPNLLIVWELLAQGNWLPKLDLIVPAGYELPYLADPFDTIFYPWRDRDDFQMEFNTKTRFVVESGGTLYDPQEISQENGWDLVALPGSRIIETEDEWRTVPKTDTIVDEAEIWESDHYYLTGVPQLFEIEELSVHANNGRVDKTIKKDTARALKAFGPCVIQVTDIPCDCSNCLCGCHVCRWTLDIHFPVAYTSLVDIQEREMLEWLGAFGIDL